MFQMSEERMDYLIIAGLTSYPFEKIKKVRFLLVYSIHQEKFLQLRNYLFKIKTYKVLEKM